MPDVAAWDAVIVGGGAAGLSAGLVLGRARAQALLVDAGQPSNSASTGIGGLLGNDGTRPADFYRHAAAELASYPSITRRTASVTAIEPAGDARWRVEIDDGEPAQTGAVILATGMRYAVPDIEGIEARWGASVFHCPFCHGWEHRDQPLAALGGAPMTVERTLLLRRWTTDLTLIANGSILSDGERATLDRAGVRVVEGRAASLHGDGSHLDAITLADNVTIAVTGLLVPAPHAPRQPELLDGLGLATTPTGHLVVDGLGRTSVAGVWAAGDLTSPLANVARAVAEGSTCAIAVTRHLVARDHGLET